MLVQINFWINLSEFLSAQMDRNVVNYWIWSSIKKGIGVLTHQLFTQLFQGRWLDRCIPLKGPWVLPPILEMKNNWGRPSPNPQIWIPKTPGSKIQKSEIHGNHGIQGIQIVRAIFQHSLALGLHCEAYHVGTPPRNGCLGCIWASSMLPQVPKQCIWSTLLNSQVESCLLSAIAKVYSSFSFK